MKFRYFFLMLYIAVTGLGLVSVLSDWTFGKPRPKNLGRRLLFALIWPFLMLSAKGRNLIIVTNGGKEWLTTKRKRKPNS